MTISAKILADSINGNPGPRLVTWELEYPRFIHPQLMTHRQFSRNAQSTRAMPTKRMIKRLRNDPAKPLVWGINKPGMQATEYASEELSTDLNADWDRRLEETVGWITDTHEFYGIELHKQIINRMLEPWAHIKVIMSSTYHENWFHLRRSEHAQPEIRKLADIMYDLYHASSPRVVHRGQWHLPLIQDHEMTIFSEDDLKMISTARCARVSYLNHDGENDPYQDMLLHDRLAENGHWSAFEHVATPTNDPYMKYANFRGWEQYRMSFPNECVRDTFVKLTDEGWEYLDA